MKKTILFSVVLGVSAAFAGDVSSENVIGVLPVTLSRQYTVISVPWVLPSLESSSAVDISTLVNPDQFNGNTDVRLYVPNGSKYDVYKISENKWVGEDTTTIGSEDSVDTTATPSATIGRGNGIFLKVPESLKTTTTYLVGQKPSSESGSVSVSTGNNLIASPKTTALDLSSWTSNMEAGDQIVVPSDTGSSARYAYTGSYWRKWSGSTWATEATTDTIPAGTGFWFISKSAKTLSF